MKKYLAEMIDTSITSSVNTSIENHARHLGHQVVAATYVFMVDSVMSLIPPTLTRDDGDKQEYTDSMGFEEEPTPSTIDRMATHVVKTKSEVRNCEERSDELGMRWFREQGHSKLTRRFAPRSGFALASLMLLATLVAAF